MTIGLLLSLTSDRWWRHAADSTSMALSDAPFRRQRSRDQHQRRATPSDERTQPENVPTSPVAYLPKSWRANGDVIAITPVITLTIRNNGVNPLPHTWAPRTRRHPTTQRKSGVGRDEISRTFTNPNEAGVESWRFLFPRTDGEDVGRCVFGEKSCVISDVFVAESRCR